MKAPAAFTLALAVGLAGNCAASALSGPTAPEPATSSTPGLAASCVLPASVAKSAYAVRYDQVGYLPEGDKWAIALSEGAPAPGFRVHDLATGCVVATSTAGPRTLDTSSRAKTALTGDRIDLSALGTGRFVVVLDDGAQFGPIVVDGSVYAEVMPKVLRFLGAQRCGPVSPAVSGHGPCHLAASVASAHSGDGVAVDDGYRGRVVPGKAVNVEGGWHDAGDYIKFVGTTAFVLAVDLLALRDHPGMFAEPRTGASFGAFRAEMRWALDWLVRMLGGAEMLHQVSGEQDHEADIRPPEADTANPIPRYDQRPAFRFQDGAGANLLGRASAALGLGAQVFSDDPAYAADLLALAKKTAAAGALRPRVQASDPPDFYPESSYKDDLALSVAILAQITGEVGRARDALALARTLTTASSAPQPLYWGDVSSLALLETALAFPEGSPERMEMASQLASLAAPIALRGAQPAGAATAFRYALDAFGDGSIEQSLGAAAVCLAAERLGGGQGCAEVARSQLHWLFGLNPFGLSFMVGLGSQAPKNVHHAYGRAAHVILDGAIVGGPTSLATLKADRENDPGLPLPSRTSPYARFSTDDLVYDDDAADYVVNEPAIDFAAPLVFVLAELLHARPPR